MPSQTMVQMPQMPSPTTLRSGRGWFASMWELELREFFMDARF
jgi:hypothetical protein